MINKQFRYTFVYIKLTTIKFGIKPYLQKFTLKSVFSPTDSTDFMFPHTYFSDCVTLTLIFTEILFVIKF